MGLFSQYYSVYSSLEALAMMRYINLRFTLHSGSATTTAVLGRQNTSSEQRPAQYGRR